MNCTDPEGNQTTASAFEVYGVNGRCVESTVTSSADFDHACQVFGCPGLGWTFPVSLCMEVRCNVAEEAVEIIFGSTTKQCAYDGEWIDLPDVPGQRIKCPRLAVICKE